MNIYVWRHYKRFSSWSMFDEPQIHKDNYMKAEVAVLAESMEEALGILGRDENWNLEEIRRIQPEVISVDKPAIVSSHLSFG